MMIQINSYLQTDHVKSTKTKKTFGQPHHIFQDYCLHYICYFKMVSREEELSRLSLIETMT
jgi:hypothetical protein